MKIACTLIAVCFFAQSMYTQHEPQTIRELTDSIQKIVNQKNLAGIMLGIVSGDSILFSGGFGYADVEQKRAVDDETLFRMGSITKMFVAMGILELVHEGKFSLDDPLHKVAPEVPFQNQWEDETPVLIIHLLEHTSGFDDFSFNRFFSLDEAEITGHDNLFIQSNSMVCRWTPGERYAYSNPGYAILGYLIEKYTGKTYDQYLTDLILQPLGMTQSSFTDFNSFPDNGIKEYKIDRGKLKAIPSVVLLCGPEAALWSNAQDMLRYLRFLLHDGAPLFDAVFMRELETPHSSLAARLGQKNGYALAMDNTYFPQAKRPFMGHEGVIGGCYSSCKFNPELKLGFVLSSNSSRRNDDIENLIVQFLERTCDSQKPRYISTDQDLASQIEGRYQFESPRFSLTAFNDQLKDAPYIQFTEGKLYYIPLLGRKTELHQVTQNTYAMQNSNMAMIMFTQNASGRWVMMVGGRYYESVSNSLALRNRLLLALAIIITVISVPVGFIMLCISLRKRKLRKQAFIYCMPIPFVLLLVAALNELALVQRYNYRLSLMTEFNLHTAVIFLSTTLFPAAAIGYLAVMLYRIFRLKQVKGYWFGLLTAVSMCWVTGFLWQVGWIALKIWKL